MPFSEQSIIELVVFGKSASGQNVFNVLHYRQSDTTPTAYDNDDLQTACDALNTIWVTNVLPIVAEDYTYQVIRGRALTGTIANPTPPPPTQFVVGEQFDFVLGVPNGGQRVGPRLPSFGAIGVQKSSDRAGRNFRGGMRLGTLTEADTTANQIGPGAYLTLVQTNTQALVTSTLSLNFGASLWEMAIFSRTLALAAPPPFGLLRDVSAKATGAKVNPFVSSQVSRKQSPTQPT